MVYKKRSDGRVFEETRKIEAAVNIIKRADGSASFSFGDSKAIVAVYGPKALYPEFLKNPEEALLRCYYDMLSFSVTERKKPGPSRRSTEISYVTTKALRPVINLSSYPNTVIDVFIMITQADASTRCAGINAASIALAHAGIPMTDIPVAVSVGKISDKIVVDLSKEEEDYKENGNSATTDIAVCFLPRSKRISLLQLDGKITPKELKEALKLAKRTVPKILEKQKLAIKSIKSLK